MDKVMVAGIDVSAFTRSQSILATLQSQFGTVQPGKLQAKRTQFWSYVNYPLAGTPQLNFFGESIGSGGATTQRTDMPLQGSFGTSHFLLKGVRCKYQVNTRALTAFTGTDATTFTSEFLNGFFQAGIFTLDVNAKQYLQIPKPFLYAPAADGRNEFHQCGGVDANTFSEPYADLSRRKDNFYIVDPEIFIAAQQNFSAQIAFPSGVIPITASSQINDTTNICRIGVSFDGIEFRPVQ